MKKVSLVALLLATTVVTAASAGETLVPGCPKAFQGFGLKGIVAYDIGTGRLKDNAGNKAHIGFRGFAGGVGVDYTYRFGNWATAIGFDSLWASSNGKHTEGNVRGRNFLQLYAKQGYVICGQVQPFVALGWENSAWRASGPVVDEDGNEVTRSKSKRVNGFLWKAGVDFLLTKHLVGGIEYTGSIANAKFRNTDIRFRPQNNTIALTLKVVY